MTCSPENLSMLSDLKRLKQIEVENSELKKVVADQALDIRATKLEAA